MLEFGATQSLDLGSETTFGLDVGVLGVLRERTRLGLFLRNINEPSVGKYRSEPIPQWVTAAVSYQPYYGVVTELDVRTMRGESVEILMGMQFAVTEMLDLRVGFQTEPNTLAGGFTLKIKSFAVDYAYSSHSVLPGTHHVALRGFRGGTSWLRIRVLVLLAVTGVAISAAAAEFPIDLNSATLEEIEQLPISEELARAMYEYREYRAYFESVYDLMKVPGMDARTLEALKPLIRIEPVEIDEIARRMDVAQRMVRSWGSSEGTNEGLIDMWIDIAKDPPNINTADVYQLMNMQNVSPVDAVAIVNHREAIGTYRSRRDLRYTPGLSGWGYYNLRSLIRYEDKARAGDLHGTYQFRVKSFGYYQDTQDLLKQDVLSAQNVYDSWWDRLELDKVRPSTAHKVYLKYFINEQTAARTGLHVWKGWGETEYDDHLKGFVAFENFGLGGLKVNKLVFGTFLVGFGQGLVMENSDYYKARKSGYSWDKRYYGVLGDVSRTDIYKHKGVGLQFSWDRLKGIGFFSNDWKDAVLNKDGSVFSPVILTPLIENETLEAYALQPMRDVLHEKTYGGNLRFVYAPGSHIGLSGYESRYNRNFDPMSGETFIARYDKVTAADNEIFSMYKSPGKYRRIHGVDWQHVYKNFCAQLEYAEMHIDGSVLKIGDDPGAFVGSIWTQYNNLHFLGLFRNHDLGFDNPYSRGFSNYAKFRGTILEDEWYLTDPLYGMLADNAVGPQAERGFYIIRASSTTGGPGSRTGQATAGSSEGSSGGSCIL
jgi:DNA uptake protein ComE-like DNA-binding protein